MSGPYRVTLLQLKPDLSAVGSPTDKLDLGSQSLDEVFALAGKLQKIDISAHPKSEPALLVYRGEKGWRIVANRGLLRVHESTSSIDDYWTVDSPKGLVNLPPFRQSNSATSGTPGTWSATANRPKKRSAVRSGLEVVGLLLLGVVLIAVGLWYGMPHKRLSDLPGNVVVITTSPEKESLFSAVAGTYATGTGKKPGDAILEITADGHVSLKSIGKDGKPINPPRIDSEQAKAGRRDQAACVVTSFGVVAASEPNAVKVGRFRWQRTSTN
ncbi:MAG TPA: hypothetical protein VHD32_03205 [Candidatus Didemnitutus sp.]|nr:hypothetical protein [Candidatus Didemnitutus sp.]